MVETLVKCQSHMAETGDSGLHYIGGAQSGVDGNQNDKTRRLLP
jgi:hypothetical protein